MKKINIIKTIGVVLMGLSITTATIASLSSCSGLSVPKAPNEFYWNSTKDYTGAGCTFWYPHDEYIVVNDKSEAYKLITDRNKYPDNYVKWDIIHTFTLGLNDKEERKPFKGWIIDFERTNTTIKYKVEIQEEGKSTKDTYYTVAAPFEKDYNPFTLKENQVSVAPYDELYSRYLCQLNLFPGVDFNDLKSVFYKLPRSADE